MRNYDVFEEAVCVCAKEIVNRVHYGVEKEIKAMISDNFLLDVVGHSVRENGLFTTRFTICLSDYNGNEHGVPLYCTIGSSYSEKQKAIDSVAEMLMCYLEQYPIVKATFDTKQDSAQKERATTRIEIPLYGDTILVAQKNPDDELKEIDVWIEKSEIWYQDLAIVRETPEEDECALGGKHYDVFVYADSTDENYTEAFRIKECEEIPETLQAIPDDERKAFDAFLNSKMEQLWNDYKEQKQ